MQFRSLVLTISLLSAAGSLTGQQASTPLTSVALFRVQPDKVESFVEMIKLVTPALDKLRDAGVVQAYGVDSDLFHTPGPNLAFWFTAADWSGISKGEQGIQAALKENAAKMKEVYELTDFNRHVDLVVRSLESGGGSVPAGVLPVSLFAEHKVKPGKMSTARMLFQKYEQPVLDQLVTEGAIYSYSMDVEAVHSSEPGRVWFITVAPDLGAQDKLHAAFEAAMKKLPAAEREAIDKIEEDVFVFSQHRDSVSQALIFKSK